MKSSWKVLLVVGLVVLMWGNIWGMNKEKATIKVAINGETFGKGTASIILDNSVPVAAIQLEIKFQPESVEPVKVEVSKDIGKAFSVSYKIKSGKLKILLYSLQGEVISPGKGEVIKIAYKRKDEVYTSKENLFTIKKVILSDIRAESIPCKVIKKELEGEF